MSVNITICLDDVKSQQLHNIIAPGDSQPLGDNKDMQETEGGEMSEIHHTSLCPSLPQMLRHQNVVHEMLLGNHSDHPLSTSTKNQSQSEDELEIEDATNYPDDENLKISPLVSSLGNLTQEQPKENTSSSPATQNEELHKPVEELPKPPISGASVMVPSSSPPKSNKYHTDLTKLLKTYDNIPSENAQDDIDPADRHRYLSQDTRAEKWNQQPIRGR